jgi:hypothetical protein
MRTMKRRVMLVIAGAALAAAALPAHTFASTELNVCTWLSQAVGDAVGTTSAAPGAVLGPNNGAQPGGDKGPFPIFFTTSSEALLLSSSTSGGCS